MEALLKEKVSSQEQPIQDLRMTLDLCQKVTADLEGRNETQTKDLTDMGNQVTELEDVIEGLEKERDDIQDELLVCQEKLKNCQELSNNNVSESTSDAVTNKLKEKAANQKEELKAQKNAIDDLNQGNVM